VSVCIDRIADQMLLEMLTTRSRGLVRPFQRSVRT
jgi:hypothetical protein